MEFRITIRFSYRNYTYQVQQINVTPVSEQFKIIARNKTVVLESDRPRWRNRGLKKRRPSWKLVEGELAYQSAMEQLVEAIMVVIEPPGKPH